MESASSQIFAMISKVSIAVFVPAGVGVTGPDVGAGAGVGDGAEAGAGVSPGVGEGAEAGVSPGVGGAGKDTELDAAAFVGAIVSGAVSVAEDAVETGAVFTVAAAALEASSASSANNQCCGSA